MSSSPAAPPTDDGSATAVLPPSDAAARSDPSDLQSPPGDRHPCRLFLALPVPLPVQRAIFDRLRGWGGLDAPFAAFQSGVLMHATLVSPALRVPAEAASRLRAVVESRDAAIPARLSGFSFRLASDRRPHSTLRVMMAADPLLTALCEDVVAALGDVERAHQKPFSGHITLAKLTPGAVPEGWIEAFAGAFEDMDLGDVRWDVDRVALYESDHSKDPPYRIVREVLMCGGGGGVIGGDRGDEGDRSVGGDGGDGGGRLSDRNNAGGGVGCEGVVGVEPRVDGGGDGGGGGGGGVGGGGGGEGRSRREGKAAEVAQARTRGGGAGGGGGDPSY